MDDKEIRLQILDMIVKSTRANITVDDGKMCDKITDNGERFFEWVVRDAPNKDHSQKSAGTRQRKSPPK